MKKKFAILGLGLLLTVLMVSAGALQGEALGVCKVVADRGHCPPDWSASNFCYVDPGNAQVSCANCCSYCGNLYDQGKIAGILDKYGCGCCCPPGSASPPQNIEPLDIEPQL